MKNDEKLSYIVTWFDELSSMDRTFNLFFWPSESSVEMHEIRNKKLFLRKLKTTDIKESDLFIGNTITLLSRQLKVTGYADEFTKEKEKHIQESTFGLIKPGHMSEMGMIIQDIYSAGLTIGKIKQIHLTGSAAEALLEESRGSDNFQEQVSALTSGPSLALVIVGENSVNTWKEVAAGINNLSGNGNKHTTNNYEDGHIESLEDEIGDSTPDNDRLRGVYCSSSIPRAEREINLFFPTKPHANPFLNPRICASFKNSTCCVILPHAVKDRLAGQIIENILEAGFHISAFQSFHLDFGKADEFFEIYKNVVENCSDMVKGLSSGMCFALEISLNSSMDNLNGNANGGNEILEENSIVPQFREFAGPRDPEIARKLRPSSLRARYGKYGADCGVHCTDLPEDAKLELEYFFKILQQ